MRLYYTSQLAHNLDKTLIIAKVALWTYVSRFSKRPPTLLSIKLNPTTSTAEIATVLLCGSLTILPKFARFAKESCSSRSSSSKISSPTSDHHLNGYRRAQSASERSNDSTISEHKYLGVAEVPRSLA
jgi:hypothetical protein